MEYGDKQPSEEDVTRSIARPELTERDKRALAWARRQQQLPQEQFSRAISFWNDNAAHVQSWRPAYDLIDEMNETPPEVPSYIAHTALRELIKTGLYEMNALGEVRGKTT